MISERGIILIFKTMETEFMNNIGNSMYYVEKIDLPYLLENAASETKFILTYEQHLVIGGLG